VFYPLYKIPEYYIIVVLFGHGCSLPSSSCLPAK
jgi:hypothetical protein